MSQNQFLLAQTASCAISGADLVLTQFSAINANCLIGVKFLVQNPAVAGTVTSITIKTYLDAAKSKLVDSYIGSHSISISNLPQITSPALSIVGSKQAGSTGGFFFYLSR